jgi:hypothetical protein
MNLASINELGTVPASGPYTVSVTNAATFIENLSVIDATTGLEMTRVASAPATGQYAVTAGVYTFAAADASHVVWLSYSYSSTNGYTVTVSNALMGAGSTFSLVAYNQYESKYMGLKFPAIKAPKLSLAMKMADFTMQNVDFEALRGFDGQSRLPVLVGVIACRNVTRKSPSATATFKVGPITLGTARRAPDAFRIAMA